MPQLPKVITSSVIRSSHQGESHGGVYIVDLETGNYQQVIDWNDDSISWEGRGADRGLRGIAIYGDHIYLAASDEIFVYDKSFKIVESYRNRYLKHCHEIFIADRTLFLTSTGFDSILEFDLQSRSFTRGYCLRYNRLKKQLRRLRLRFKPTFAVFDPNSEYGPSLGDTAHINSVYYSGGVLYFSGTLLGNLLCIKDDRMFRYAWIPFVTHNARPFRDGVLLNDTSADRVTFLSRRGSVLQSFFIKQYREEDLLLTHLPKDHARQGFGRGLCVEDGGDLIVAGSSPATISVYQLDGPAEALKTINITMDVRNAVHGLEIWPY